MKKLVRLMPMRVLRQGEMTEQEVEEIHNNTMPWVNCMIENDPVFKAWWDDFYAEIRAIMLEDE